MPPKGSLQANNRSLQNFSAITLLYFNRLGVVAEIFFKDEFAGNALFFLILWPFAELFVSLRQDLRFKRIKEPSPDPDPGGGGHGAAYSRGFEGWDDDEE